ncbi:chorismate synthase [Ranunculus cassubicifolius]
MRLGRIFVLQHMVNHMEEVLVVIIDGCPPRIPISEADMQVELDRRRPGQSRITTPRKETDTCRILSGVNSG